jgi:hypothetical protein
MKTAPMAPFFMGRAKVPAALLKPREKSRGQTFSPWRGGSDPLPVVFSQRGGAEASPHCLLGKLSVCYFFQHSSE